jgi:hypothetical protein
VQIAKNLPGLIPHRLGALINIPIDTALLASGGVSLFFSGNYFKPALNCA